MKRFNTVSLLYVENDINIRENYCFVLKDIFKEVYEASTFEDAMSLYGKYDIDIMIVDINLDGYKSGIDLIKKIRDISLNTKIIVTSAYSTVENLLAVSSLNLINFLVKPMDMNHLFESLKKALTEINTIKILKQDIIHLDKDILWDFNTKELRKNSDIIELTKTEKAIMQVIFSSPYTELSYDYIINEVWNYDDSDHKETLRTLMSNIRKKLPKGTIKTLYNIGYQFDYN